MRVGPAGGRRAPRRRAGQSRRRGKSGSPFSTRSPPGYRPQAGCDGQPLVARRARRARCARQISAAVAGMAGEMSSDTIRSTSRASPSTRSTVGSGVELPRLGGLERGVGRADEPPRRLEGALGREARPGLRRGGERLVGRRGERASRVGRGARRQRTWSPRPSPLGRPGCRGCSRGPSCTGPPWTRGRTPRPRRAGPRARGGSGPRPRRSPP